MGMEPDVKSAYFNGHKHDVVNCLYAAALSQNLSLISEHKSPGTMKKFNLKNKNHEVVSWVDISEYKNKEISADFFYSRNALNIKAAISTIISQCKSTLN